MARICLILTTPVVFLLLSIELFAQSAPSPKISSLTPTAVSAGGPDFFLLVDRSEYTSTSVVRWDSELRSQSGRLLNTEFINSGRLAATVTAELIAEPGLAMVAVVDQELMTVSNTVTFIIAEPLVITSPSILPPGTVGVPYFTPLNASGGIPPYTWARLSPFTTLPPRLRVDEEGAIVGTPSSAGTFRFGIRVGDDVATIATQNVEITIVEPITITPNPMLPPGTVGTPYGLTLTASGGTPPYTWSIVSGALAPGLTLNSATGAIGGTPSLPGLFDFVALAADSAGDIVAEDFRLMIDIDQAVAPQLAVRPGRLLFSFVRGSQAATRKLFVFNDGGGSLNFQVEPPPPSEAIYLNVDAVQGDVTAGDPQALDVTADPTGLPAGTYLSVFRVTSSTTGQSIPVEVAMAISSRTQSIGVSQTGLTFTHVAGGAGVAIQGAPGFAQSDVGQGVPDGVSTAVIKVLNVGSGMMPWNTDVSTLSGGPWLSVTPRIGTSDPSDGSMLEVRVDPLGLDPGAYSALIEVSSEQAAGLLQYVTVVLNLLPVGSRPGPIVTPKGLIFIAPEGGPPPEAQEIQISNLTAAEISFTARPLTLDGDGWLTASPEEGAVAPGDPTTISVQVDSSDLNPGIYRGLVRLLFQGGLSRTVGVILVVVPNGPVSLKPSRRFQNGCIPSEVAPVFQLLGGTAPIPAGWPAAIEVKVVDDCGAPMEQDSAIVDFTNISSPSLALGHSGSGVWTATWNVPNIAQQSMAGVTVTATDPGGVIGSLTQAVSVVPNLTPAPRVNQGGVVHAASFVNDPLGPGTIVSIFGQDLSAEPLSGGKGAEPPLPLPTELAGTRIILAGRSLPLLFSREDQVNAIVPFELTDRLNESLPLFVQRTDASSFSVSEPVFVMAAPPGVFTQNQSGSGPGAIQNVNFQIVTGTNPVKGGDAVIIYCGGLGAVTPDVASGAAAPGSPLARVDGEVVVTIGGLEAQVLFAGLTPTFASLYQINVIVPQGLSPGQAEVVVSIAGQTSTVVTLFVE